MGIEEGTGKEIGGRKNANTTMDVRSYEAGQDKKINNKRDNGNGGNRRESPGKEVEVVHVMRREEHYVGRRAVEMKVGPTGEKEERKN